MSNLVLIQDGKPRKFEDTDEIIHTFCERRFAKYTERCKTMEIGTERKKAFLESKKIFIEKMLKSSSNMALEVCEKDARIIPKNDSYSYLLDLPIKSISINSIKAIDTELAKIQPVPSPRDMWLSELALITT